jgi:hypothetical protein
VPKLQAKIGPIRGEMSMLATIATTLLTARPIAEIEDATVSNTTKSNEITACSLVCSIILLVVVVNDAIRLTKTLPIKHEFGLDRGNERGCRFVDPLIGIGFRPHGILISMAEIVVFELRPSHLHRDDGQRPKGGAEANVDEGGEKRLGLCEVGKGHADSFVVGGVDPG